MSSRHNPVAELLREIEFLSRQETEEFYGIQFLDQGKVFDNVTDTTYDSLAEWAEQNTDDDTFEQFGHHSEWED